MAKILLSLTALLQAREVVEPSTGIAFSISALSSDRDNELQAECQDLMGNMNAPLFQRKVAHEVIKGWKGVGDVVEGRLVEVPCNKEAIDKFLAEHGNKFMPWVIRQARSFEHYREEEKAEAKNG